MKSGEVPKAYVVKSQAALASGSTDEKLRKDILEYVQQEKARFKWITGGVEFLDAIPKSPSGKILRRLLRDLEKNRRTTSGSKI